jgi:predicted MFS family arabinose efflux permease
MAHNESIASSKANPKDWLASVTWMSVIAATGVGVVYIPQPIQPLLADEFSIDAGWASATVVSIQAGYALGVFFLVALGDRFSARAQVTTQLALTASALLVTALATNYLFIVAAFFVAGATATVGQILVASALRLSPAANRARTAATLVGAIVIGLFTVRTLLGSLAELLGWRGALAIVALIVIALIPVSWRYSPAQPHVDPPKYRAILASIPALALKFVVVRRMTAVHTLVFAGFISLWSMSAVHTVANLGLSVTQGSLLGAAGIAGGLLTMLWVGRQNRLSPSGVLAVSLTAALTAAVLVVIAPDTLWLLIPALFLVSFAMSSEQVVVQARALREVEPSQSGRANTVFIGATFLGSSVASAIAATLYISVGYQAVGLFALACVVTAIVVAWLSARAGMLRA